MPCTEGVARASGEPTCAGPATVERGSFGAIAPVRSASHSLNDALAGTASLGHLSKSARVTQRREPLALVARNALWPAPAITLPLDRSATSAFPRPAQLGGAVENRIERFQSSPRMDSWHSLGKVIVMQLSEPTPSVSEGDHVALSWDDREALTLPLNGESPSGLRSYLTDRWSLGAP